MIIPLESGTCTSKIDIDDIGEPAAICFQWSKFIANDWVPTGLLQGQGMWPLVNEYGEHK
jgi:hypothetical protein